MNAYLGPVDLSHRLKAENEALVYSKVTIILRASV